MNRNKPLDEFNTEKFNEAFNKMTDEDKELVFQLIVEKNYDEVDNILRKYGYAYVVPVENRISDDVAEMLAASLAKHGTDRLIEINNLMKDCTKNFWENSARFSSAPYSDYKKLIEDARAMESSFYEKNDVNDFVNAIHGENAVLMMKAAGIMDLIGCQRLRNDLLTFFNILIDNAEFSKTMEIYYKKKVISEDRSLAKKGKTNKHHQEVLRLAENTWRIYPNASVAGLAEKISSHLNEKWKDVPSLATLQKWLKLSDTVPDVPARDRNRNFELVV